MDNKSIKKYINKDLGTNFCTSLRCDHFMLFNCFKVNGICLARALKSMCFSSSQRR